MTTVTFFFFQTEVERKIFLRILSNSQSSGSTCWRLVFPSGIPLNFDGNFKYVVFLSFSYKSNWDNWQWQCIFLEFNGHKSLSLAAISLESDEPSSGDDPRLCVPVPYGRFPRVPRLCWQLPAAPHGEKKSNCQKSSVAVTSWAFTLEFPLWNFAGVISFFLCFK